MNVENPTVLAINPGHNGSVALVKDGKLEFYIEEERITRIKYDGNPFGGMLYALDRYKVDILVIGGTYNTRNVMEWSEHDPYESLAKKYNKQTKINLRKACKCKSFFVSYSYEKIHRSKTRYRRFTINLGLGHVCTIYYKKTL